MKFIIQIDCDNAAFDGEPLGEIVRILEVEVKKMKRWVGDGATAWNGGLQDINGNTVGRAVLSV